MPKHPAERAGIPLSSTATCALPNLEDPAWKAWAGHVEAGRIGSRPVMTRAQLARHIDNEMILLGRGSLR